MSDQVPDGTVALVTGASCGIGAATARRLAREGAAVALVAWRRERLAEVVDDIKIADGHAVAVDTDITEAERAYQAAQDTVDRFGRLDVLVNNAGDHAAQLGAARRPRTAGADDLNVGAMLHVTHAAVPYLIDAASTPAGGIGYIVTRDRRVAVNEMMVRAGDQTW
jgi:NADP-dependent 3-hydroxy acid dehydrogenase YdfG